MAACALVSTSAHATDKKPSHIGSTSLCGDSYVRALLSDTAPERIAALSWQSRDPKSLATPQEKKLPRIRDDLEVLLSRDLDHVVFGPFEGNTTTPFLKQAGISSIALNGANDLDGVYENLRMMAESIGEDEAQHRIEFDMMERVAALPMPVDHPKILYLSSAGFSAGPGTFVDHIITAAGGDNIITTAGWPRLDPEYLIQLNPDVIVTGYYDDGIANLSTGFARHKTVNRFIGEHKRVDLPGAWLICGSPYMIDAIEHLNRELMKPK